MALKYEVKYDFISKIGDKEIEFKQWTAKDERLYLQLIEKHGESVTDKMIFDTLIAPCIKDKNIVLSASEQKKLLIDIRIESISDSIKDTHVCEKCKEITEIDTKIKDCMTYIPSKFDIIEVGNLKFNMGPIRTNKEKESLKMDDGVVAYIFNDFLLHIHSIEIDGVLEDSFTKKELFSFIDNLPAPIFDEVFEKYQEMVDELIIEYKFTCPHCNEEETIDYSYIPNLLWV